jgi:RNA polymerase sigma-70 factor (ECF subfamily)
LTVLEALDRYKQGDIDAYGVIYSQFVRKVYDFCYYKTFDKDRAEDITSEVFMKGIKSIGSFRGTAEAELGSWLLKIAYNLIVDGARAHRDTSDLDVIAETHGESVDHATVIDSKNKLEEVLGYLDTLKPLHKDILIMRIWDELSFAEIAAVTGKSADNCKQIVSRTLREIQDNIAFLLFLVFFIR